MLKKLVIVFLLFCCQLASGQTSNKQAGLDRVVSDFKKKLVAEKWSAPEIEFAVDTFRVEQAFARAVDTVATDFDMSAAGYQLAERYDSLMNKYYKKLAAVLKGQDKQALVSAQKAWLAFRDSETKLVGVLSKEEYAGGGTMQRLVESSNYMDLVRSRTVALFQHYLRATQAD